MLGQETCSEILPDEPPVKHNFSGGRPRKEHARHAAWSRVNMTKELDDMILPWVIHNLAAVTKVRFKGSQEARESAC